MLTMRVQISRLGDTSISILPTHGHSLTIMIGKARAVRRRSVKSGQLVGLNGTPLTDSDGRCWRCGARPGVTRAASRSGRGGFVLLDNAGRDAAAFADRDAVVFRPRADIAAVLTARCGTHRSAALS